MNGPNSAAIIEESRTFKEYLIAQRDALKSARKGLA